MLLASAWRPEIQTPIGPPDPRLFPQSYLTVFPEPETKESSFHSLRSGKPNPLFLDSGGPGPNIPSSDPGDQVLVLAQAEKSRSLVFLSDNPEILTPTLLGDSGQSSLRFETQMCFSYWPLLQHPPLCFPRMFFRWYLSGN